MADGERGTKRDREADADEEDAGCCFPRPLWTALVTGGNRGLGLEIVRALVARDNTQIFLGCRDLEAGRAAAAALRRGSASECAAVQIDVASAASIEKALFTINVACAGRGLDCLINNAGVMPEAEDPAFSLARARSAMAVNFRGAVAVTDAFLPMLRRRAVYAHSNILNVSSGVGARTCGLLDSGDSASLLAENIGDDALSDRFAALLEVVGADEAHPYRKNIPTVGYGLSKAALNQYTRLLSKREALCGIPTDSRYLQLECSGTIF